MGPWGVMGTTLWAMPVGPRGSISHQALTTPTDTLQGSAGLPVRPSPAPSGKGNDTRPQDWKSTELQSYSEAYIVFVFFGTILCLWPGMKKNLSDYSGNQKFVLPPFVFIQRKTLSRKKLLSSFFAYFIFVIARVQTRATVTNFSSSLVSIDGFFSPFFIKP